MSISNVKSATQIQGSKVNKTQTASNSVDVKGAKGLAASARETLTTNSGRESAASLVNAGGLLGPDQAKLSGFADIAAIRESLNQQMTRTGKVSTKLIDMAQMTATA